MKNTLWIIIAFLTLINLVVDYVYFNTIQTEFIFGEVLELTFTLFFPLIGGLLIGGLIAIIPFKNLQFKERLQFTMPIVAILIASITLISTTSVAYYQERNDVELGPVRLYSNIEIPQGLDCSNVREGLFETDNLIIERKESKQIQINKATGAKVTYQVKWVSDCEYLLIEDDSQVNLKIKIVEVEENGYACYVAQNDDSQRYKIKKRQVTTE